MMPTARQTTVKRVTSLGTWFRSWTFWTLPRGTRLWLLLVETFAVSSLVVLPLVQPISLGELERLGALALLAVGWSETVRRNERIRAYLQLDGQMIVMPTDIWTFGALIVAPSGWAIWLTVLLTVQISIHAIRDRSFMPYRIAFNTGGTIAAQVVAGGLTDLTDHRTTGSLAIAIFVVAAAVYSFSELIFIMTGVWLWNGRPPVRSLMPDKDDVNFTAACLALGVTSGVLLLQAPLAVLVLLIPLTLLQRGTLVTALHRNASSDSKTGVTNSSAWQRNAKLVLDQCRATGKSAAVLLIDIDNFRTINSDIGHVAADRLLVAVAQAVRAEVRNDDCTGRFGGDEFVVIVDDIDPATARAIGERIRESVASTSIELDSGRTARATVSIGLAHAAPTTLPANVDELLDRADQALYASKHAGRDYVSITELAA